MAIEFTVQIEDRPGVLADLTEVLAKNAISIAAIHATPCPDTGIVQFITDNNDATINALKEASLPYTTRDVLLVRVPDEPGALARLARGLGDAGVNINAIYTNTTGQVVIDTNDRAKAQQVVLALGMG